MFFFRELIRSLGTYPRRGFILVGFVQIKGDVMVWYDETQMRKFREMRKNVIPNERIQFPMNGGELVFGVSENFGNQKFEIVIRQSDSDLNSWTFEARTKEDKVLILQLSVNPDHKHGDSWADHYHVFRNPVERDTYAFRFSSITPRDALFWFLGKFNVVLCSSVIKGGDRDEL